MPIDTTTQQSEAAGPTDSAEQSNPKEGDMPPNNSSTAGSTDSSQSTSQESTAGGAPADSANPKSTRAGKKHILYAPGATKKKASDALAPAAGNTNPLVIGQVKVLEDAVTRFDTCAGPVSEATGEVEAAAEAMAVQDAAIEKAMAVPAAMLVRVLAGGAAFFIRCRGPSWWETGSNFLAQLPPGRLGLEPSQVAAVQTAINLATPVHKALVAARARKAAAVAAYMAAKREVLLEIRVLETVLKMHRLKTGSVAAAAEPVPAATKHTAVVHTNGHAKHAAGA